MVIHISARLAWHDSGWNGHICDNPNGNTYCVGQYSFPGDMISEGRDVEWEQKEHGKPCRGLSDVPPCIYSINAFGAEELPSYAPPPVWFRDSTKIKKWLLPACTIATWPYEEMYCDEVKNSEKGKPKYNPVERRKRANEYFSKISPNKSLIFYYSNYSNPFSENDEKHYVIVGASRVKSVGKELVWEGQSKDMEDRYGPSVWMRNITSHYPDEGLRIPYHSYMDRPEIIDRILFFPENSRHFKYATRHISDDGALGIIERLNEIVGTLLEIGDSGENWQARQAWLTSIMAELWQNRGLYPGILRIWEFLTFAEAIPYTKQQVASRGEQLVKDELFAFLDGKQQPPKDFTLKEERIRSIRKEWKCFESNQQRLLRDVLPRFDLQTFQIQKILTEPENVSIHSSHKELDENPYILSEEYVGYDPDDQITFNQIDHGMLPSPELGEGPGIKPGDWQRLRALSVEQLQRGNQHTFLLAEQVLSGVNHKLNFMPDWKKYQFTLRHMEVEREDLEGAIEFRPEEGKLYLYRKTVFEDERIIEANLRKLAARQEIPLRFPVTKDHWANYLTKPDSPLAKSHPSEYKKAISQQVAVCQQIFRKPLSVLCGAAGTGKTTIVEAIIKAIEKGHGTGTSFRLLAPTGKAADRLRERTNKDASTIHSFLAECGWLNDNLTFRRADGVREDGVTTFIIDEASMLDLSLLATFFRAVNWNAVQRLIFVGDPNQLPPIGTGKVFADLLDWLSQQFPENIGELETNMRQITNRLTGKGTGILDLANLYVRTKQSSDKSQEMASLEEEILKKVQEGGDVTGDLRVLYWDTPDVLEKILINTVVKDMEHDTGLKFDGKRPDHLWNTFFSVGDEAATPELSQVISPYRGELFGIENLNSVLQRHKNTWMLEKKGYLGGITYKDKVIQIRNRPQSNPIWAYNTISKKREKIQIYNGEIGFTKVHGFDHDKWTWSSFHLEQFQVVFSRKEHYWVNYQSESDVNDNLELAYAISVHKAQGSEFQRVYFVLPKKRRTLLSRELFYTGITRAQTHCTLLIEEDISPLLTLRRPENSRLIKINSSLFLFRPAPPEFQTMYEWYEEGKIHRTLADYMVRSKSEVIIANILFDHDIPFQYEVPLYASDGTFYLPDFTIKWQGEEWYWEHEGMLHDEKYRRHQKEKHTWYKKNGFFGRLIVTSEKKGFDSKTVLKVLKESLGIKA